MKKLISLITVVIFGLMIALSLSIPVQAQPQPQSQDMIKVIIGFHGSSENAEQQMVQDAGGHIQRAYHRMKMMAATLPASAIQDMRESANVAFVEEDGLVQVLDQQLPWGVAKIHADLVHPNNEGNGVKVAIIDTGIDINHPDLNVQGGISYVSYTTSWDDDNGHGTHVAGIIAALDNTIGVIGVAPEASLYAVKVLDGKGMGNWSNVIAGIDWAIDNGMQVINMSIGSLIGSTALKTACNDAWNAGIVLVAAAGNNDAAGTVLYPAKYNSVIAVGATDKTNTVASFSDIGTKLELVAPGVNIYSTYKGESYATMSGTSMATPHVAGAAALLIASGIKDENGDGHINDEVRQRLDDTAVDLGSTGRDNQYGYGLIDVSIACASATTAPTIDHYAVSSISSPQIVGTPFSVNIQAQDKNNNNISNISESVNITFGNADAGSTPTVTSTTNGIATINMIMTVAQNSQTITFTGADSGKSGTSNSFSVNVAIPSAPILKTPTNGSTVLDLTPGLGWNASTGAVSYRVQVSNSSSFTSMLVNQTGLTNIFYDVSSGILDWNTTYYWRVNANNAGGSSNWSAYQSFITSTKPASPTAPTLNSPAANSTVSNQTPGLVWNVSTGAVSYGLQVSTSSSFTSKLVNQTGITSIYYDVLSGVLGWNTIYYWRVNTSNVNGTSSWSAYWSFKTPTKPAPPTAPTLSSPTTNSTESNQTPRLAWNASTGAVSYGLQVSTSSGFTSQIINQTGITNIYYDMPSGVLGWNTTYYWRVNASNSNGTSSWSVYRSFKTPTKPAPPTAPTLSSPMTSSTLSNQTPRLAWNASTGAVSHGIQVSTSSGFTSQIINQTGIIDIYYDVPSEALSGNTTYYWRVNDTNTNGTSSWSAYRSFKTPVTATNKTKQIVSDKSWELASGG